MLIWAAGNAAPAAEYSLSGVSDGAEVALFPNQSSTNLAIVISSSGAGAGEALEVVFEGRGQVLQQSAGIPPVSLTLSNIAPGKYLLLAWTTGGRSGPPVVDAAFDVASGDLPPANDDWANAPLLTGAANVSAAWDDEAGFEDHEPDHAGLAGEGTVWWKWRSDAAQVVSMTTRGSAFDTVLAVYSGTSLTNLTLIAAADDSASGSFSQVQFTARAGEIYSVAIAPAADGAGAEDSDRVTLAIHPNTPAPSLTPVSPAHGQVLWTGESNVLAGLLSIVRAGSGGIAGEASYSLLGTNGTVVSGTVAAPFEAGLPPLPPGDYVLSWTGANDAGLEGGAEVGFSVRSKSGALAIGPRLAGASSLALVASGEPGLPYRLEGSLNLVNWTSLVSWTNFPGLQVFSDSESEIYARRFYRLLSPP